MKYLAIILLTLLLISCKTEKPITGGKAIYENINEEKLFKNIKKTINFSSLKIKSSIDIEAEKSYPSVSTVFYITKGKQIWANASLILPLARANILPSGFKMYERINKTYIDSDFDYINNLLHINFIDYQNIENLLLGKLFFPTNPKDYTLSIIDNHYVLTSLTPIKIANKKNEVRSFSSQISFDSNYNLSEVRLEDKVNKTQLEIEYRNYIEFENYFLPKNIKIFIKGKKQAKILIDYNKFESEKMETPFEIPKGYTQRQIN